MSSFFASSNVCPMAAAVSVMRSIWVTMPSKVLRMVCIRLRTSVDRLISGGSWAAICGVTTSSLPIASASALVLSASRSKPSVASNTERMA